MMVYDQEAPSRDGPAHPPSGATREGGLASVRTLTVGRMPTGEDILECRLCNARGSEAAILNLGATLRRLLVSDGAGGREDLVLGYDAPEQYMLGREYFGATLGRYANRIANARFSLGGERYQLAANDGPNAEHGGEEGFDRRLWRIEGSKTTPGASLSLSLVSPDGDQGFPGELTVQVVYTLTDEDELRIEYTAMSRATTVINLSHHSYWNIAGGGSALEAELSIEADEYLPVDGFLVPTGELRPVAGTVFDFRIARRIDARIRDGSDPQLILARGFDHTFVLRGEGGRLRRAARLADARSGRVLEVLTTEPGLQFYSGNFLTGAVPGKCRELYRQGDGIALETQHFPDSPNQPHFPSTVLEAGQLWHSTTVYRLLRLPQADTGRALAMEPV